jgi:ABC-type antimicrobial peptide transport system permease subunit
MAIGASPQKVVQTVLARALRLAVAGSAIGLTAAFAGGRVIQALLFEVEPRDPTTLIGVTVLLAIAALASCAWPAARAARVEPITTLRAE